MTRKQRSQKEQFVTPRVTQAVGVELSGELLAGSPGTELMPLIMATGHDTYEVDTFNGEYWE